VINNKYKSNISAETVYIRVALNRGKIKEKLGLIKETNPKEISNNCGVNLHCGCYYTLYIYLWCTLIK